jgi:hypothetical protein
VPYLGEWTQENLLSWALVAHACNPSYSGDRDEEDRALKSVWAVETLSQKNPLQKRAGGVAQGVGPEDCKKENLLSLQWVSIFYLK